MGIFEQVIDTCKGNYKETFSTSEIISLVEKRYGRNAGSIIPSDYCYNRINMGIDFKKHIFIYVDQEKFKFVGENYPYSGKIFFKPKGGIERIVGEWNNGKFYLWEKFPKVSIEYYKPGLKPNGNLNGHSYQPEDTPISKLSLKNEDSIGEIPTKEEIEISYRRIAQVGREIDENSLKRAIEVDFTSKGKRLQTDWWVITKKNMEEWSK